MTTHRSYGSVPIFIDNNNLFFALVRDRYNSWGFPKGYPKKSETSKQAAIRETFEECGLVLEEADLGKQFIVNYNCIKRGKAVKKEVMLYLTTLKKKEALSIYDKEVIEADWVAENKISEYIKYNEYLDIANEIINLKNKTTN